MTGTSSPAPPAGEVTQQEKVSLLIPIACMWMLILMTFTPTTREGPNWAVSFDPFSLGKILVRGGSFVVLGLCCLLTVRSSRISDIRWRFTPFVLFLGWAMLSVFWAALRSISLFQSGSLFVLAMLGYVIATRVRDEQDVSALLKHLSLATFMYSALLSVPFVIYGGIDRFAFDYVHPTTAGSTASIGLVTVYGAAIVWRWRWALRLLAPATLVHCAVLFAAYNRTALLIAAVAIIVFAVLALNRFLLGTGMVGATVVYALFIIVDPGLKSVQGAGNDGLQYLSRGQDTSQIAALSGREELWSVMWESWQDSPIIGHGYFVTSREGVLDIWGRLNNYTAHNLILQALVTTGVVGLSLILLAGCHLLLINLGFMMGTARQRQLAAFCAGSLCWHFLWALPNAGILGPVAPLSVAFFVVVGILFSQSLAVDLPARHVSTEAAS